VGFISRSTATKLSLQPILGPLFPLSFGATKNILTRLFSTLAAVGSSGSGGDVGVSTAGDTAGLTASALLVVVDVIAGLSSWMMAGNAEGSCVGGTVTGTVGIGEIVGNPILIDWLHPTIITAAVR